ncbi:hypothetical protein EVAR_20513_1 [Eumeta japonica]|uniref:Uncharacterized protein n=1 Tax=Eumeta variegata TaxID=151549 RepID=A0A4C1VNE5_EUMVA|nr:hypothetical protein EVAR_20513_1 [Eumeta japonica]
MPPAARSQLPKAFTCVAIRGVSRSGRAGGACAGRGGTGRPAVGARPRAPLFSSRPPRRLCVRLSTVLLCLISNIVSYSNVPNGVRLKDSPKANVDGGGKKDTKKKNCKQKTEGNGAVTAAKNDKATGAKTSADKEGKERTSPKNDTPLQVLNAFQ